MSYNKKNPGLKKKTWLGKDVYLNVGPKEALFRIILGLIIGGLVFIISQMALMVLVIIVSFYFFISGCMLFCYVKYFWRHSILHKEDPLIKDPELPVEKL